METGGGLINSEDVVLLIAHGSPQPEGNAEAEELGRQLQDIGGIPVHLCFIEHARPLIAERIDEIVMNGLAPGACGRPRIFAVPVILTAAGHAKRDIPEALELARRRHPGMDIRLAEHLANHSGLRDILVRRIVDAISAGNVPGYADDNGAGHSGVRASPVPERATLSMIFVARGSTDPAALAEVGEMARKVAKACKFVSASVAFVSVVPPDVAMAIRTAVQNRSRCIVIVPYFLFRGILLDRISSTVAAARKLHPEITFILASHIGPDQALARVLFERVQEKRAG